MFQDDRRGFFQPVGPVSLGRARNYSTAGVHSKPSLPRSLSLTNLFDTNSFSSGSGDAPGSGELNFFEAGLRSLQQPVSLITLTPKKAIPKFSLSMISACLISVGVHECSVLHVNASSRIRRISSFSCTTPCIRIGPCWVACHLTTDFLL